MSEILTIDEVSVWLKMSHSQVRNLIRQRTVARMREPIPCLRICGNIRFSKESVEEWLKRLEKEE